MPWLWGFALTHVADRDAAFDQKIFNISVADVESIVKPNCVANDIWRESIPLVCVHGPILAISVRLVVDIQQVMVRAKNGG
jgi:hypothetical protein